MLGVGVGVGGAKVPSLGDEIILFSHGSYDLYFRIFEAINQSISLFFVLRFPTCFVGFHSGQPTPQPKRKPWLNKKLSNYPSCYVSLENRLPIETIQTSVPSSSLLHFPKNNPLLNSKHVVIHGCPFSAVGGRET